MWPFTSLQVVMALETSEIPSPSMSSPSTNTASSSRVTLGVEAMKSKLFSVRNVISFLKSKPTKPGLLLVPTIRMSI